MKSIYHLTSTLLLMLSCVFWSCQTHHKVKDTKSAEAAKYPSAEQIGKMKVPIEQFYVLSQGSFVFQRDSEDLSVLQIVPIFTERWGEYWLYSESAMSNLLEEPFDQAVYKIEKHTADSFFIYSYRVAKPESVVIGWYDRDKLKQLNKEDLISTDVNNYTIVVKNSDGSYKMEDADLSKIEGGVNNRVYYQNTTNVDYSGLCMVTKFFDKDRKQTNVDYQCNLFKRDLENKYYKIMQELLKKKDKLELGKSK